MLTIDIHSNKETVNDAKNMCDGAIKMARKDRDRILCLIVGYGSKGTAHKIKSAILELLEEYKTKKIIKDYINGTELDIFNVKYQSFIGADRIPEVEKKKRNPGAIYISL